MPIIRKKIVIIILIIIVVGLTSIIIIKNFNDTNIDQNLTPTKTIVNESSNRVNLISNLIQMSDGKLLFSIVNNNDGCVNSKDSLEIMYKIKNTSRDVQLIRKKIVFSSNKNSYVSTMIPIFFTNKFEVVWTLVDSIDIGFEKQELDPEFYYLNPNEETSGTIKIDFPQQIIDPKSESRDVLDLPQSGDYYLKIVYRNYVDKKNLWVGEVTSNLIKICLQK